LELGMGWNRYHSCKEDMVAEMLFCSDCYDEYTLRPCKKCGETCEIANMKCFEEDPGWDDFYCPHCVQMQGGEIVETRVVAIDGKEYLMDREYTIYALIAPHCIIGRYNTETQKIDV
jgi:hypothetical protein